MKSLRPSPALIALLLALSCSSLLAHSTLVFSEIMYHPEGDEASGEWIELHNQMAVDLDISSWTIGGGIDFVFPDETIIPGGSYIVIALDPEGMRERVHPDRVFGPFQGRLDNGGERIELRNNSAWLMDTVRYRDGGLWPVAADGSGATLAKQHPDTSSDRVASWVVSAEVGGTPGGLNFPLEGGIPPGPDGIVSYWAFEESRGSARDTYGDNDGRVFGGVSRVEGIVGKFAVSFDNTTDALIDIGAGDSNNLSFRNGVTLEVLIRPEWSGDLDDLDHIFRKQDGQNRIVFGFQHDDGAGVERDVEIDPPVQPVLAFGLNVGGEQTELDMPLDGVEGRPTLDTLKDGEAHHIAASYDAASGRKSIYVDGVLAMQVELEPGATILSGGNATAYIGNMAGRRHPFTGTMDELAIWNRALAPEEIAQHVVNVRAGRTYFDDGPVDGPAPELASAIRFSEIRVTPEEAWIEVTSLAPNASLAGLQFGTSRSADSRIEIAEGALSPGEFRVFQASDLGFAFDLPGTLFLYSADGTEVIDGVRLGEQHRAKFFEGEFAGRWLTPESPTPNANNEVTLRSDVVINEIMYHARPDLEEAGRFEFRPLLEVETSWRYEATGQDLGTAWREPGFEDGAWPEGQALFYAREANLPAGANTMIETGALTYYFRKRFDFDGDPSAVTLALRPVIDDGAIVYLNGEEIYRVNMPEGEVSFDTPASRSVGTARFTGPFEFPASALRRGENVFAVEVHNRTVNSNDLTWGMELLEVVTLSEPKVYRESDEAWIELYNRSDEDVDLSAWSIDEGVDGDIEDGTILRAGEYAVLTDDRELFESIHPDVRVLGIFGGRLSRRDDRLVLRDATGNPVDELRYYDRGYWPRLADGGGSSLELRNPDADNSKASSWAASDESQKSEWAEFRFELLARQLVGPSQWQEFVLGLLSAGEILVDDISVKQLGTDDELIQNGSFEGDRTWRFLGNHRDSRVIEDPDQPGNQVLLVDSVGATEHMSNHIETTLANRARVLDGRTYVFSFRARWLSGSRQLHTRLYFNRAPRTTILPAPSPNGTPGRQNSRFEENIGPSLDRLAHQPLAPLDSEACTVSVRVADPDGIDNVKLWTSVSGRDWTSVDMSPAGDGVYRADVAPTESSTALVQFYVEATDSKGASSFAPPAGPNSGALFQVKQEDTDENLHNLRILVSQAAQSVLLENTNLMSNASLPGTLVYNEREVFYDIGVRLRGSQRGRPDNSRTGYNIRFRPEQYFRGKQRSIGMDRSGGWVGSVPRGSQDEILAKHVAVKAGGIPGMYDDLCRMIAPTRVHTSNALLMMTRYSGTFLNSAFQDGADGTLFTYELVYSPTTTTNGNPESFKRPLPDTVVGTDHRSLGEDKEQYRWIYLIENNEERDDYSAIMEFAQTLGLSGDALDARSREIMDIDQFMRAFALYSLCGIGDTYMSGNFHNNRYYVRPIDGKVLIFPWDMDFAFVNGVSAGLWGPHNLRKVIEIPRNTRRLYGHFLDIMDTAFNGDYMRHWVDHYGGLTRTNFASLHTYMVQRERFVRGRLPSRVPFSVLNSDGEETSEREILVSGNAWIDADTILVAELPDVELEVDWQTVSRWRATVPVAPGENELTFLAFSGRGELVGSDTLTVTSTAKPDAEFVRGDSDLDGRLSISDAISTLFYLFRGGELSCLDAADANDDETLNLSDPILVLSYLFTRGEAPAAPFPEAGGDPEGLALDCAQGI
ncbi:MAG: lamin tail domain-containing protein [Planctomycetota bacterium]